MCNEAARRIELHQLREDWSQIKIPLRFPEGFPNMAPLDSIKITDPSVIIRAAADAPGETEMVTRRWSWPAPTGKPVYNYRSDGREFGSGRCLIPIDGFYEFTDPPAEEGAPKKTEVENRKVDEAAAAKGVEQSTREVSKSSESEEENREREGHRGRHAGAAEHPFERVLRRPDTGDRNRQLHHQRDDRDEAEVDNHRQREVKRPAQTVCLHDAEQLDDH